MQHEIVVRKGRITEKLRYLSLEDRLKYWTKIITGSQFTTGNHEWQEFRDVMEFRDELIHYKPETEPSVYAQGTIDLARAAVRSAEAMIERFFQCNGEQTPAWVHAPYREIH
jgi:hypothetical protein